MNSQLLFLSCSGEGAPYAIQRAELFAFLAVCVHGILVAVTLLFFFRAFVSTTAAVSNMALLVLHPYFTLGNERWRLRIPDVASVRLLDTVR